MATETRTTYEAAFDALTAIEILSTPGQELSISEEIELICEIYNICRKARVVTEFKA